MTDLEKIELAIHRTVENLKLAGMENSEIIIAFDALARAIASDERERIRARMIDDNDRRHSHRV